jgi:hypothetical protein
MDRMDASSGEVDLNRVWTQVAAQVWRRRPGRLEHLIGRVLRSPGLARALLTTPSLLVPWLIASAVVLAAGAVATAGTGQPVVALAAPALAGAGIAYAYGPGVDVAWELSRSMAVGDGMVLLVRALAVFAVNTALALAAAAASSTAAGLAFGWLAPMTAISALALAAARLTQSANLGVAAAVTGWVITVLASQSATGRFAAAVDESAFLAPYLIFACCCIVIAMYPAHTPRGIK